LTTSAEAPAPRGGGRRQLTAALGVLVSLALLYWVLHGVSLSDVLTHLKESRPGPLILAVAVVTADFLIRAARWRLLLNTPDGTPIAWRAVWHATAMGFMANNTLPLRLGEVLRAYAASRLGGVPLSAAFSSIAVERALDLLTLVALLGVALFRAGLPADTIILGSRLDTVALRAGVLCVLIFVAALFVVLFPRLAERITRALIPFPRIADRVVKLIAGLTLGLTVLRSPSRLALAVVGSLVVWLVNALSFYIAFAAFGIEVGFAGALLVQSLLAFGVAAPSSPGYFGIFELVVAASLALFGVPKDIAVAYGITYHITTFIPITLLGLYSLVRTGLHVKDATAART
jgi:uncharacterized protein (TIRG00374 family)